MFDPDGVVKTYTIQKQRMFDPDGVISTNRQQEAYNSSLTACKIKKNRDFRRKAGLFC